MKQFIEVEQLVQIPDLKCEQCSQSLGCNLCRAKNPPKSILEFQESEAIKKSIQVKDDETRPGKKYIYVEYPVKDGRDLDILYTDKTLTRLWPKVQQLTCTKDSQNLDF